jgi:hypothetical protein
MDLHVWWSLKEVCVPVLVYFFLCVDIEVLVGVHRDQHLSDVRLRTKKDKAVFLHLIDLLFPYAQILYSTLLMTDGGRHGVFETVDVYCRLLLIAHCQGDKLTDVSERAVFDAELSEVRCCMIYIVTKTVPNCDWPGRKRMVNC